jgi:large subunit ribosomal protein L15
MVVNLSVLEESFNDGDNITPAVLKSKSIVQTRKGVKNVSVKILGSGSLSKKLTFTGCSVSQSAREQIEKAGGKIV